MGKGHNMAALLHAMTVSEKKPWMSGMDCKKILSVTIYLNPRELCLMGHAHGKKFPARLQCCNKGIYLTEFWCWI